MQIINTYELKVISAYMGEGVFEIKNKIITYSIFVHLAYIQQIPYVVLYLLTKIEAQPWSIVQVPVVPSLWQPLCSDQTHRQKSSRRFFFILNNSRIFVDRIFWLIGY